MTNTAKPVLDSSNVNIAVTLNKGAVILYDQGGNPQFLYDRAAGTFVLNAAFSAGTNYNNILGADLARTGALSVITFQGSRSPMRPRSA